MATGTPSRSQALPEFAAASRLTTPAGIERMRSVLTQEATGSAVSPQRSVVERLRAELAQPAAHLFGVLPRVLAQPPDAHRAIVHGVAEEQGDESVLVAGHLLRVPAGEAEAVARLVRVIARLAGRDRLEREDVALDEVEERRRHSPAHEVPGLPQHGDESRREVVGDVHGRLAPAPEPIAEPLRQGEEEQQEDEERGRRQADRAPDGLAPRRRVALRGHAAAQRVGLVGPLLLLGDGARRLVPVDDRRPREGRGGNRMRPSTNVSGGTSRTE